MTSLLSWSRFIYYQHALLSSPAESCQFELPLKVTLNYYLETLFELKIKTLLVCV